MDYEMTVLEGMVEEIVYTNYANGYTVCTLDVGGDMVTATGCMPYLSEGESVKLTGNWTTHPEYGEQFGVRLYEKVLPTTAAAILRYLGSGVVKGIRLATAKKIVDKFGDDTLSVLLNEPHRLAQISGISKAKAAEIGDSYAKQQSISSTVMFLQQYGIGAQTALKVYRRFGQDAVTYIKDDPFVLVDEVNGVSFKMVDRIAYAMGIGAENLSRLRAGVKFVLNYNAQNSGHTYLPFDILRATAAQMLGVSEDEAERAIYSLSVENAVILQQIDGEQVVFLEKLFAAEGYICRRVSQMTQKAGILPEAEAVRLVSEWEAAHTLTLADEQREAVVDALCSRIMVLTGGPGTGKTTIVNTIIEILQEKQISIALTAPTGRAAKRMSEVTNLPAKTIHRLLEITFTEDEDFKLFARDEGNPLDEDVIIVDESSMVDVLLGSALFQALKPTAHLILVGDADQLPPVGAGNLLGDLIESGAVKTVRLTKIFRQAAQSMIVQNAHRIISGEDPLLNAADSDFYFVARGSADTIAAAVAQLCKTRLPQAYGYDPMKQIQVLSPMKKGPAGVRNLNKLLQQSLNPPSPDKTERKAGERILREGDRVMQTKNNYDLVWEAEDAAEPGTGVFNGDMGVIEEIDLAGKRLTVKYDDKRVHYTFDMLEELELAYAVTVHKSQGSEFDVVVMPVYHAAPMLMKRNLLYTAVTRAKQFVVLVGNEAAIRTMVASDSENKRFTSIRWWLSNEEEHNAE